MISLASGTGVLEPGLSETVGAAPIAEAFQLEQC